MVVSDVIEMLTAKSESFGYQGGVGDLDSGKNPSGKSCHHVAIQASAWSSWVKEDVVEVVELVKTWRNFPNVEQIMHIYTSLI